MTLGLGARLGFLFWLTGCAATTTSSSGPYEAMTAEDIWIAQRLLQRTLDHAPDGTTRRWTNDESGHSGAITPVRTYVDAEGQFCRDYLEQLLVGDHETELLYSACREESGWEL